MTKFLIILILIIIAIIIGVSYIQKFIQSIFNGLAQFQSQKPKTTTTAKEPVNEVIYNKDNIVVLKGEAKSNEK